MKLTKEQWHIASVKGANEAVKEFIGEGEKRELTEEQKKDAEFKVLLMTMIGAKIEKHIKEKCFIDKEEIKIGEDEIIKEITKIIDEKMANMEVNLQTRTTVTMIALLVSALILSELRKMNEANKEKERKERKRTVEATKVIIVKPGMAPYVKNIDGSLKNMQKIVGGLIEVVGYNEKGIALIANEEGKLRDLPLNRRIKLQNGCIDFICGTFILVKAGEEDFVSIPEEEIPELLTEFSNREWIDWSANRKS